MSHSSKNRIWHKIDEVRVGKYKCECIWNKSQLDVKWYDAMRCDILNIYIYLLCIHIANSKIECECASNCMCVWLFQHFYISSLTLANWLDHTDTYVCIYVVQVNFNFIYLVWHSGLLTLLALQNWCVYVYEYKMHGNDTTASVTIQRWCWL